MPRATAAVSAWVAAASSTSWQGEKDGTLVKRLGAPLIEQESIPLRARARLPRRFARSSASAHRPRATG